MTDLQSLLTRLEGATGPDRELDDLIAVRVTKMKPTTTYGHELLGNLREAPNRSPAYTASLDAALALAERVLPGWTMDCDATAPECGIDWSLHEPRKKGRRFTGTADTHSLALLIALLRALINSKTDQ